MKLNHLFPIFAAAALIVSCSDEPAQDNGTEKPNDEKAYVHFSINLPSTKAVGRDANDGFEDGTAKEYEVNTAHLILFSGNKTDEEDVVTVLEKIELNNLKPWNTSDNQQVTTEANIIAKLSNKPTETQQYYALIILNGDNGLINQINVGDSFEKLYSQTTVTSMQTANGLVMMNAPLAFNEAGSVSAKTLVAIPAESIAMSQAEAATKEALNIYVERGTAKLTMVKGAALNSNNTVYNPLELESSSTTDVTVNIEGWAFDIANTKSYFVRNVSSFSDWATTKRADETDNRFYGTSKIETSGDYANASRIYWAIDPNYSETSPAVDAFTTYDLATANWHTDDFATAVEYPLENTFAVSCMNQDQTGRIVIKGKMNEGTTLYRVGSNTTLYDDAKLKQVIANVAKNAIGKDVTMAENLSVSTIAGKQADLVKADFATPTDLTDNDITSINNALGQIDTFLNGECYYKALVKHFGDTYTPWTAGDPTYGTEDVDAKYLGRYGMVRNNWYELSVNSVSSIGSSTMPEITSNTDDENASYINVTCKILSWAKHHQGVDL